MPEMGGEVEKAVTGAGSPVAEGRGPAGPVAVGKEGEENLEQR